MSRKLHNLLEDREHMLSGRPHIVFNFTSLKDTAEQKRKKALSGMQSYTRFSVGV